MTSHIRSARPDDCDELTAIMLASRAYRGAYAAILQGYAVSPALLAAGEVHVAEERGRILGFYALTEVATTPELDLLFVRDEAQGKGIGALLVNHMAGVARALGIDRVLIVAHPPAEAFYRRMGARRIGTKPPADRVTWARPVLSLPIQAGH